MELARHEDETASLLRAYEDLARVVGSDRAEENLRSFGDELERFARGRDLLLLRYRLLFHEAPDPYLVTDPDGVIIEANAAAADLLGFGTTIVGSDLGEFVAAEHREAFAGWLARVHAGVPAARWDTSFHLPGVTDLPVEISLADDLTGIGYRWLLRDQRERAAAERQLQEVAEHEHRAAEMLRTEERTKSNFLVSLSHDLRGPIGALVHQAELLTMPELPDDVRQRSRTALESNATLLSQMLDSLVDIERFALGDLKVRPTNVALADLLQELDDEDGASTETHCAGTIIVSVDVPILRRALRGLVNAARTQAQDTKVTIVAESRDDEVDIVISSTCDHVAADAAPLDNRIDVRLARTLIDLHGGTVQTDQLDDMREIRVSLPVAAGDASIQG